jgi:16S rRNA (cytosine967-C5)-methyltransferase
MNELRRIQESLIEAAAGHVRPGGTLVYSTCTISPSENEDQVHNFLARHPEFEADDLASELPEFRHPRTPRFLQLLPHVQGTDGFFIARLRRVAEAPG